MLGTGPRRPPPPPSNAQRRGPVPSISPPGWGWRRATRSPAARCSRHERAGPAAGLPHFAPCCRRRRTTDTALGAFYRRLSSRIGKAKAVTATARKVAVLFYNAVRHGMEYVDPGASSYETRYRTRVVNNLHRRAKAFGFVLQPLEPKAGAAVS